MIVGAGGYIGKKLAASLAADGIPVLALSSADGTGIDPASGILREDFAVPAGITTVYYLAQSPRYRKPHSAAHLMAVNVVSSIRVADASRKARVAKFIYASTGNVYRPDFAPLAEDAPLRRDNWYALSKIHAEEALALFRPELDVTIARIFGVYGPHQHGRLVPNLVRSIIENEDVLIERNPHDTLDQDGLRISLCYIDDVVSMLRNLAAHVVPVVNVASDEVLSIRDIALSIGSRIGKQPRLKLTEKPRENDLIADISRLKELLKPAFTPFANGIARVMRALPARP